MIRRVLILFLAMALLPVRAFATSEKTLEEQVYDQFKRNLSFNGEVVVAKDGEIVYQQCYGKTKGVEVTPDYYYRIASVSKLVTGTAYMRLVETGRISLDENIGTYLGGDQPFTAANRKYPKVDITSRMLMNHTSCIWKLSDVRKNFNVKNKNQDYFYQEKPGTKYHYSNVGAGTLGCIIEAVTGQRLNDAVSELLFTPMGLDAGYDPQFLKNPEMITTSVVRAYNDEIDIDHDFLHGYGGVWMKCADLCRIGIMLCDYGMLDGKRFLEEETVREMLSSQKGKGGIMVDAPYGLTTERLSVEYLFPDRMIYGHGGCIDNILCGLFFDPENRFVVAIVSNCDHPLDTQKKLYGLRNLSYQLVKIFAKEYQLTDAK